MVGCDLRLAWARHNARPGCQASGRRFSTPHTGPRSSTQRTAWWPPHSGTAAASSVRSGSSTPKRSRCWNPRSMRLSDDDGPRAGAPPGHPVQRARVGHDPGASPGIGRCRQGNGAAVGGSRHHHPHPALGLNPLQVPSTLNERMVDAKEALELSELLGDPTCCSGRCRRPVGRSASR